MKYRKIRNEMKILFFSLSFIFLAQFSPGQNIDNSLEFRFWTVGNDGYKQRFGTNSTIVLRDIQANTEDFTKLLIALNERPQTREELVANLDVCKSWLDQTLRLLTTFRFLGVTDNDKLYVQVPVLTNDEMKVLQDYLTPIAARVAGVINDRIVEVQEIYNREKQRSDPEWTQISHLVIDKFLIDGTFHRGLTSLERERGFKRYYSEEQKMIPAFFIEARSEYATFGSNWYGFSEGPGSRHVYVLHGGPFKRFGIPFNEYRGDDRMEAILKKIDNTGSLEDLSADEKSMLDKLGWIHGSNLAFPVIYGSTLRSFMEQLEIIGTDAAEAAFDEFQVILDAWERSDERQYADGAGDYIQVCYHLLFPCIIRELTKIGTLLPIPESVPEHFGVFMTIGSFWD